MKPQAWVAVVILLIVAFLAGRYLPQVLPARATTRATESINEVARERAQAQFDNCMRQLEVAERLCADSPKRNSPLIWAASPELAEYQQLYRECEKYRKALDKY